MLLPIKWLKEYIDIDVDIMDLADRITQSGSHVESVIDLNRNLERIVVGKICKIDKHPNADKLLVTTVDTGKEKHQIITGARNIKEDDYVAVALEGARLADGSIIGKSNFKGLDSNGMLCSLKELGYDEKVISKDNREGVLVLEGDYPLGSPIEEVLELYGQVIELEITPNRPDCLSVIGMAREAAATYNKKLILPTVNIKNEVDDIKNYIKSIKTDEKLCNRYYAKVIKDVKIEKSPQWLQNKLMEAGMRPINNIVDITNYVLLELGEPLHAFDLDKVGGKEINVRLAKEGEVIKTLDGVDRILDSNDLVIADEELPIGIAGVMGGFDSEITHNTKNIILEAANFNSNSIRLTSKKLGLRSEASSRFEKGIDVNLCEMAANRVCQLIEEIGAGTIVKGAIDVYNDEQFPKTIPLRDKKVNEVLGIDLSKDKIVDYLNRLELKSQVDNNGLIQVIVPTFRRDIVEEIDLVEEIGRLYGFHNIEENPLIGVLTRGEKPYSSNIIDKTKSILQGLGLNEVMTYSFISPKAYDKINMDKDDERRKYIELLNPLGEDFSVMRTTLIPNILDLLSRNYNRGVDKGFVYEIGNIFEANELPLLNLPNEKKVLTIGMYGAGDFYTLKNVIDECLYLLGIKNIDYLVEDKDPSFHPFRTAKIALNGINIGVMGEVHIDVQERYEIDKRVYLAQIDFDTIIKNTNLERKYREVPKFPAILRDIAIVVDKDIPIGDMEKLIWANSNGLIESVELFDVYMGGKVPDNKKSVAFSISYRSLEKTLADEEINVIEKSIISDFENKLGAELRSY